MNKIQEGVNTLYPVDEAMAKRLENDFTYHAPIGDQAKRYERLRASFKALAYELCQTCPPSRELSVALTNLEVAGWAANAAIARNEELG